MNFWLNSRVLIVVLPRMAAAQAFAGAGLDQAEAGQEDAGVDTRVDVLAHHGINSKVIEKLKAKGLYKCESIMCTTMKQLQSIDVQFTDQVCKKLYETIGKICQFGFMSAKEYLQDRQEVARISTGSSAVDTMLLGGIETGSMTELFGEFRSGKSQLCHQLAVMAQMGTDGHMSGKVMFIDTEGTFRPERIKQIAMAQGMDPEQTLENISYAKALSSEHQMTLLDSAAKLMAESEYCLLVVDSATALFRTDFSGRGELADRQQKLAKYLRRLHILAEEFGCAVVVTNQVTAKVDGGLAGLGGPQVTPIGGNIMAHAAHTRLSLRKGKGPQRVIKVFDSPLLPEAEASFQISEAGITD